MNLPSVIEEALQKSLGLALKSFSPASGGCINNGGKISTSQGDLFIKWNDARKFPGMFETEAKGLKLLASADCIHVPSVVCVSVCDPYQFMVLEHIGQARPSAMYWRDLGRSLATVHRMTSPSFGLDHDNYIGSLPQVNGASTNWVEFFIDRRLEPQLAMLNASASIRRKFERLYTRLPQIFPVEHPSLLHGDLWSGNLIRDHRGHPCLIDPAVYFGHREMDLAFTRLFGGFDRDFYDTYKEVFPLQPGHAERLDVCNLYPLLVHANLFGGHYLMEIEEIVSRWT